MSGPTGTRRVLVVGGGTGIGRAVAEALLAGGGHVAVAGRRPDPLREVAGLAPDRAVALPCDVTVPADRDALLGRAADALGGLDGLVWSAGSVRHQPVGAIDEAALRDQLELNLVAALRLAEQAVARLGAGGAVVLVASTLAARPVATSLAYSAAKAGLLAAMRTLALAAAPRGVRVNAVSPGIVDTELLRGTLGPGRSLDDLAALHPLGRLGRPEDVAGAVIHLLGAPWTTGSELVVDGGLLLRP